MNPLPVNRNRRILIILKFLLITIFITSSGVSASYADVRLDLFIELKAPELVDPGGEFTVNVSYGNSNTARTPDDTWVEAKLPDGVQFISAKDKHNNPMPPDSMDGNTLHWDVGTPLPDWQTEHLYILLNVDGELPQNRALEVSAEIGTSADEVRYDNNSASVISYTCDMAGSYKQAHAYELMPADVIDYTITISLAQGSSQAYRDVMMVDTLPPTEQARFFGWTSEEVGTYDGSQIHWQGRVHSGHPIQLKYRLGIEGDVPSAAALTNQARLYWWDEGLEAVRELELEPTIVQVYLPEDAYMIGPDGGQWQHSYGVTLIVPEDAVQEFTRFQFAPLFENEEAVQSPPGWLYAQCAFGMQAFQFGEIHEFNAPLELAIQYSNEDLVGLDRNKLRLWYRQDANSPWEITGEPTFHQDGIIKFETDHFTEFALFTRAAHQIYLPLIGTK